MYLPTFRSQPHVLLAIAGWLSTSITTAADNIPPPPQVPVRGYILMDYQSGNVLAEVKSEERMEPASITKLMTAYVVYKAAKDGKIRLTDSTTISEKAWRTAGSKMFIKLGSQIPLEDLLMGMTVQSGNDASVALAEHVAGSEETFAQMMNQAAEQLGMKSSHFTNAPGLSDPNHYMSPRDIATLTRALIREFPEQYSRYAIRSFKYNNIDQPNRNKLLAMDPSVDGVKTGHTQSAGYCLVSSAKRDDTRVIAVVLGADKDKDRFTASQTLLNYGFSFFESRKIHDANSAIAKARVWKGQASEVGLGVLQPLHVTVAKGQAAQVSTTTTIDPTVIAPIEKHQRLGEVVVKVGDQEVSRTPLVALEAVPESGWFGKLIDSILLFFHKMFS